MMLPVSRVKGHQSFGMVTNTTTPWLTVNNDPVPHWQWLVSWHQTTPLPFLYPHTIWTPEHTHLIQWGRPTVEFVPLLPLFYHSSSPHPRPHAFPKLAECWVSPEEVGMFQRQEKNILLPDQIIQRPVCLAPRTCLQHGPSQHSGHMTRETKKTREVESEETSNPPQQRCSVCPFQPLSLSTPPSGGAYWERAGLNMKQDKALRPIILSNHGLKGVWLQPLVSLERRLCSSTQISTDRPLIVPVIPVQVMKEIRPSIISSQLSSKFTLLTNYRLRRGGMAEDHVSYREPLLLRIAGMTKTKQCVTVSLDKGEGKDEDIREEDGGKDNRPVASAPVPGSPWCVVWTGDDRIFFFNPTIHRSVWEQPGELIGRDISCIIEDPPHKRKKRTDNSSSICRSSRLHCNEDEEDGSEHNSKRNRTEESASLIPPPADITPLPLELRITHFREMMLERGVSAFSTWEKELHKMVFDPRYLLLTSNHRKQVFDQYVKSRMRDEYREKKSKLHKAREDFKQLLGEAKITSRATFKKFCVRYHGDWRFNALYRKKEQEGLFNHYIALLKKRNKENRARLKKMR